MSDELDYSQLSRESLLTMVQALDLFNKHYVWLLSLKRQAVPNVDYSKMQKSTLFISKEGLQDSLDITMN